MNSSNKVIIYFHIGFPKTATTTLQKHYFGFHPEINYLGRTSGTLNEFTRWLNNLTRLLRDKNIDYFMQRGRYLAEEILSYIDLADNSKAHLVSFESIVSISLQPNHISPNLPVAVDLNCTLKKIQCLNCELLLIKPILTIRRQDNLLHSYYAQNMYKFNKFKNLNDFAGFVNYVLNDGYFSLGGSVLNYHSLYDNLCDFFGSNNVGLFLFEDFNDNPKSFFTKFARFLNVNPIFWVNQVNNQIISPFENKTSIGNGVKMATRFEGNLFNILNQLKRRFLGNVSFGLSFLRPLLSKYHIKTKVETYLEPDSQKRIFEKYKEGNKALDHILNLELNKYGYY